MFPLGKSLANRFFTRIPLWKLLISSSKGLVSSRENRFIPIREYMENQSFRDILAGFLEENDPNSPMETAIKPEFQASRAPETPLFHWSMTGEIAKPAAAKAKSAYPKTEVKVAPAPAKPAIEEPKWKISELSPDDQRRIKILVQMGAVEIIGEISMTILKKAHRRLAKKLHPDTAPKEQRAGDNRPFLALQSIYEDLCESLSAMTSAKASGSESASAPASRRQDAA